ncbi:hypothetical protein HPB52_008661 [Rhipicephalus sanguineus]|uniref:Uncharacterized protein n=1 Tax=Rhipicephalus sanguineus TaxID=34632 RepID=A0A9D4Q5W5_RHISA|nr:hypothetical protein HPB52_008661 [Rhipicephalus sanguineus]
MGTPTAGGAPAPEKVRDRGIARNHGGARALEAALWGSSNLKAARVARCPASSSRSRIQTRGGRMQTQRKAAGPSERTTERQSCPKASQATKSQSRAANIFLCGNLFA